MHSISHNEIFNQPFWQNSLYIYARMWLLARLHPDEARRRGRRRTGVCIPSILNRALLPKISRVLRVCPRRKNRYRKSSLGSKTSKLQRFARPQRGTRRPAPGRGSRPHQSSRQIKTKNIFPMPCARACAFRRSPQAKCLDLLKAKFCRGWSSLAAGASERDREKHTLSHMQRG